MWVKCCYVPIETNDQKKINVEIVLVRFKFPWLEFISSIFEDQPDVDVDESEIVSVDDWNYLVAMQHIFKEYSEKKPK